jgi:hypothetical protein
MRHAQRSSPDAARARIGSSLLERAYGTDRVLAGVVSFGGWPTRRTWGPRWHSRRARLRVERLTGRDKGGRDGSDHA